MSDSTIFDLWKISEQELSTIILANPSLYGFMIGYIAEFKLRSLLQANPNVSQLAKPDDHSRKKGDKNDLVIRYLDRDFTVEVKSLQTNSIKRQTLDETYTGKAQVDASDKRSVTFSDGSKLETTCLLRGEFDILAINLFQFRHEWDFAFALNEDLPSSKHKPYSEFQRKELLATTVNVSYPVQSPFTLNPFVLLDKLIAREHDPNAP